MKFGLICDLHMPENEKAPQWVFCMKAVEGLKKADIAAAITLGDIAAFGEYEAFERYLKLMEGLNHSFVLGNSDVRDKNTEKLFTEKSHGFKIKAEDKILLGIDTPYAKITQEDRNKINELSDGDIVMLHHSIQGLEEESRAFFSAVMEEKALIVIHAHSHKVQDYMLGKSHIIGLRAIDPEKSIGDFPCVTYFDTETGKLTEELFSVPRDVIKEMGKYFGISCVDNHRDVKYAAENGVYAVELRCNGKDWEPDLSLIPEIEKWREKTGGYLSVHMPNLYWENGSIKGAENWYRAVEYANAVKTGGMTMHPPRVKLCQLEEAKEEFLALYKYAVENVGENVKIGIENIHLGKNEKENDERGFGYTPPEVSMWIDAVNQAVGKEGRVGHTLDVGHARNNGGLAQKYPISRWFELLGNKTVAYHIHQVIRSENGMKNHNAIEDWFGPMISYVSYFYAWEKEIINHVPIFLEVRGCDNYDKSIRAFEKIII